MVDNLTEISRKTAGNFFPRKNPDKSDKSDNAYCRNVSGCPTFQIKVGHAKKVGHAQGQGDRCPLLLLGLGRLPIAWPGKNRGLRKSLYLATRPPAKAGFFTGDRYLLKSNIMVGNLA